MRQKGLLKAIKYFGSQQMLAKMLGVTQQAVNNWLNRDQRIPEIFALMIFVAAKGFILLTELISEPKDFCKLLETTNFYQRFPMSLITMKDIRYNDNIDCCHIRDKPTSDDMEGMAERPILIDAQNRLIVCACYLRLHHMLNHKEILVHRLNLREILEGEISLTGFLQNCLISEQVMLGLALEDELGKRQGVRNDLQLVEKIPQVPSGSKSREFIAKKVGFNNDRSYRQAKEVVAYGSPLLVAAMDQQIFTIHKAKQIIALPQAQQLEMINASKQRKQLKINPSSPIGGHHGRNPNRQTRTLSTREAI